MKRHCFEPHELFMLDDSKIKPVHTVGAVSSFCNVFGFYLRLAFQQCHLALVYLLAGAGIACQALLATASCATSAPLNSGGAALQRSDECLSLDNLNDNYQCVKWGGLDASALKQRCQFGNHNRGVISEHTIIFFTKNKGLSSPSPGMRQSRDLGLAEQDSEMKRARGHPDFFGLLPLRPSGNIALFLL